MEHKYSTYLLILLIFIGSCTILIQALDSRDIDDICKKDNSLLIRIAGQWICTGDVYLEEDLRFPVQSIKLTGTPQDADLVIFRNNTIALAFDDNINEYGYISFQMPHGRLDESPLQHHIHWSPSDNSSGSVKWCFEYTCANIGEVFNYTKLNCVIDSTEGEYSHQMTPEFTQFNNFGISAMCIIRIYRDAVSTEDNYTADALLLEYDVNYRPYSLGREDMH